ncbi:MAG: efflux RND transporter periplasmic adaptor subunit [bacterium]|nr:efflux RND transporter periplasmic adaptor subunit [bacterium]MDT8395783.1 efflux RND transporter periplasmic adaptor subunit [bacterium]
MKKPSIKAITTLTVILILVLVVAARFLMVRKMGEQAAGQAPTVQPAAEVEKLPVNIAVEVLATMTVEETFFLPGTLEAWEDLTLSLEQSGTIKWIGPSEGSRVRRGEEILRIDTEALEAQLSRNQVDLQLKEKQLGRVKSLLSEKLVSEKEFDEANHEVQTARTALEQSSITIRKSTLVSPIDGILDKLFVDRGEYGNPGTPAAVVVKIDKLKVNVDVPEKSVSSVKPGQMVKVFPAEVNGSGIGRIGKIIHVSYIADQATRTYRTRIQIDNSDGFLRPGMIVRVRFVRSVIADALVVPLYAVIDREGGKFVFVEEDGTAVRREVRLGPIINGKVVVFGGVQIGEHLVVKGQQMLLDGGPVTIIEAGKDG